MCIGTYVFRSRVACSLTSYLRVSPNSFQTLYVTPPSISRTSGFLHFWTEIVSMARDVCLHAPQWPLKRHSSDRIVSGEAAAWIWSSENINKAWNKIGTINAYNKYSDNNKPTSRFFSAHAHCLTDRWSVIDLNSAKCLNGLTGRRIICCFSLFVVFSFYYQMTW